MFTVTYERFETKLNQFVLWDTDDIAEAYFSENFHQEEIIFESDVFTQAKNVFEIEKSDCKTFTDGTYLKTDVIRLYKDDQLMQIYAAPLKTK